MEGLPIQLEEHGPVLVISYHGGCTDEEYEAHLRRMTERVRKLGERYPHFAQVYDATRWMRSTATQRSLQSQWIKDQFSWLKDHGGFCAFVVPSPLVRGGLTAVLWMVTMPGPYKTFRTQEAALRWAQHSVTEASARCRPSTSP